VGSVRVAIIGVGQLRFIARPGRALLPRGAAKASSPAFMHPRLGGYHVGDIEFSAAFDIDKRKVGKDSRRRSSRRRTTR